MSNVVDSRVVEMRFDNKQFESNVKTSMSTLEKLKQKLNLSGASKGLKNVESAASKVNMSGLSNGIQTVTAKFSALQVVGVTALANITNSAIEAGKNIVSALTIDPIKDGFTEYETQMNAVQTILANTQKEGTTIKQVNKALDTLNTYADKTIYNFTEMTRNIGTFTSAGVKLDTSVSSIKGIANLAALSGSNSQQASTAMYQLSQALATGTVKLMDWNSVVNAGMGGQVFQDALIRTSEHLQTGAKAAIEAKGSFRDSLQEGWLTTEVLTQTLDQFATAADTQKEYEAAVKKFVDQGYSQEEAKQMADLAKTAGDAATKVKTFTQFINTTKEALGSGWTKTWQLVVGDFEEAKEVWTKVSDTLSAIINRSADARNKLIEGAMGSPFGQLAEKISKVTGATQEMKDVTEKYSEVVNKVIRGDFGNGQTRFDALSKAGYDWMHVQNLVNEQLGCSYRYATDFDEAQQDLNKTQTKTVEQLLQMSDAELKQAGFAKDEVEALRQLEEQSKKTGIPISDILNDMSLLDGRSLLLNSFKNVWEALCKVFGAAGKAWRETFEPISSLDLYNAIAALHKFTSGLIMSDENADKLRRTMKGLFTLLKIGGTIFGGGIRFAITALSMVLKALDMDMLDLTARAGDMIVKFGDFLFENKLVEATFKGMASGVKMGINAIKEFISILKNTPQVKNFVSELENMDWDSAWEKIGSKFKNLTEGGLSDIPSNLFEAGKNIFESFQDGLDEGAKSVISHILNFGAEIINAITDALSTTVQASPLKSAGEKASKNISEGFQDGLSFISNAIKKVFPAGIAILLALTTKKAVDTIDKFAAPFEGVGDILSSSAELIEASTKNIQKILKRVPKIMNAFAKQIKANAFKTKAEGLKEIAEGLAIMAAAVWVLAKVDAGGNLDSAINGIIKLSVVLGVLYILMSKMGTLSTSISRDGIKIEGLKKGFVAISTALLMMSASVKLISSIKDPDSFKQGFTGLLYIIGMMASIIAAYGLFVKESSAENLDKLGDVLKKMATSILILSIVAKLLAGTDLSNSAKFIAGFTVFVAALAGITHITDKDSDPEALGNMVKSMAIALAAMVAVVKLVNGIGRDAAIKGAVFAAAFLLFVKYLAKITKCGDDNKVLDLGKLLLSISVSMLILVGVIKLIGYLNFGDIVKGAIFMAGFLGFLKLLVMVTSVGTDVQIAKVASTVLAMSVAIGVLAGVAILLSFIDVGGLVKGILAITALGAIMALMIKMTQGATDMKGSIIAMAAAIAVMAASVAVLSMIDTSKLIVAVTGLGVLMAMFAVVEKAGSNITGSLPILITMTAAIAVMAGAIYLIASLPIESTIVSVASLATLMLAFSTTCLVMSKIGAVGGAAAMGAVKMVAIVAGISAVLVGIAGLVGLIPGAQEFLDGGVQVLEKLGKGLGGFLGNIVGGFAAGITSNLPEMGSDLSEFMDNLAPFISGLNTIDTGALNSVTNLGKMIASLGSGSIMDSIATFITGTSSMDRFKEQLDQFGDAVFGFSEKITSNGGLDTQAIAAATNVGKMLTALQASITPIGGLKQFFTGNKDLGDFGNQVQEYGNAIASISKAFSNNPVDSTNIEAAKNAGELLLGLQKSLEPVGGLKRFFTGNKDLGNFGSQVKTYCTALAAASDAFAGKTINEESITVAKNAGALLAELQKSVGESGGIKQGIFGKQDLGNFGNQVKEFADAMATAADSFGDKMINEDSVKAAANAGDMLTELQKAIPEEHWLDGKITLSQFGDRISDFGSAMSDFSTSVGEIDAGKMDSAISVGDKLKTLASNLVDLDTSGIEAFSGSSWGGSGGIKSIGDAIKGYSDSIGGVNVGNVSKSITAANRLKTFINGLSGFDSSGINSFDPSPIGSSMQTYSEKVSSINTGTVSSSINSAQKLANFISSLSGIDTSGVASFKSAVKSLGETQISQVASTFSKGVGKITNVGSNLSKALSSGLSSNSGSATSAASKMVSSMETSINSQTSSFSSSGTKLATSFVSAVLRQVGSAAQAGASLASSAASAMSGFSGSGYVSGYNLGAGYVSGVLAKVASAYAAGYAVGAAGARGINDGQKSHSPSKLAEQSGKWLGQGLVIGITGMTKKVYNTGYGMGETGVQAISDAIAHVSDIITSDMDSTPTITPVIDLTNVKNQANSISGMFSDANIGAEMNIRAIGSMMRENRQNGTNDDVVYAINKLRKDLGNVGNTYNSVNGVTYENGTEVSDAVSSLARALRIEGRR
jgi:tape measure domain-containing protein